MEFVNAAEAWAPTAAACSKAFWFAAAARASSFAFAGASSCWTSRRNPSLAACKFTFCPEFALLQLADRVFEPLSFLPHGLPLLLRPEVSQFFLDSRGFLGSAEFLFDGLNPSARLRIALPADPLCIRLDLMFEIPRGLHDLITFYLRGQRPLLLVHRQRLKTQHMSICLGLYFDKLPLKL